MRKPYICNAAFAALVVFAEVGIFASGSEVAEVIGTQWEQRVEVMSGKQEQIKLDGVEFLKVHFSSVELLEGDKLVVSDGDGEQVQEYDASEVRELVGEGDNSGFWALTTFGDSVVVKVASSRSSSRVVVDKVDHGLRQETRKFAQLLEGKQESVCGSDQRREAMCWKNQYGTMYDKSRAVARMTQPCGGGRCTCTAWRVAGRSDTMITNNHCIATQGEARGAEVFFNFENSRCNGNDARSRQVQVSVKEILVTDEGLDMTLFTINNPSKVSQFGALQLDNRAPRQGEEIYIPQHPGGRDKEIAITTDNGNCKVDSSSQRGGRDMGYKCDTEGGSSGSPVLAKSSHRVIALHHLGGCNNGGVRTDKFYSRVSGHLNGGGGGGGGGGGSPRSPPSPPPPRSSPPRSSPPRSSPPRSSPPRSPPRRRSSPPRRRSSPPRRRSPRRSGGNNGSSGNCPSGYVLYKCGRCWTSSMQAMFGGCR